MSSETNYRTGEPLNDDYAQVEICTFCEEMVLDDHIDCTFCGQIFCSDCMDTHIEDCTDGMIDAATYKTLNEQLDGDKECEHKIQ